MTPERYQRIKRLFHAAMEAAPEARAHFLDSSCGADANLRQEVQGLLADAQEAGDFLANPITDPNPAGDWIGIRLNDRYMVDELIAASELTRVYVARDEQLHSRKVVV